MGKHHEAVIRGAELLDEVRPDWYNEINKEKLDIGNCTTCVLGQLYGGYISGVTSLVDEGFGESHGRHVEATSFASRYGFEAPSACSESYHRRGTTDYAILNMHWQKQIEKRIMNDGIEI